LAVTIFSEAWRIYENGSVKIRTIFMKLRRWNKEVLPFTPFMKASYSQSGEDLIVDYCFGLRNVTKPTYLDIGANHPFSINNTFLFYQRGARGVNIDANANLIRLFDQHRPRDMNVNVGAGDRAGQMEFFNFDYDALSSFSEDEANKLMSAGHILVSKHTVPVMDVNDIIHKYCGGVYPDFVSIDVEGLDEVIIQSMKFTRSKPKVICLETVEYSVDGTGKKRHTLIEMVISAGYTVYADTNINTIFVENNWWYSTSA
jgi:FkbM family methyltransferase